MTTAEEHSNGRVVIDATAAIYEPVYETHPTSAIGYVEVVGRFSVTALR